MLLIVFIFLIFLDFFKNFMNFIIFIFLLYMLSYIYLYKTYFLIFFLFQEYIVLIFKNKIISIRLFYNSDNELKYNPNQVEPVLEYNYDYFLKYIFTQKYFKIIYIFIF